jgi:hypothetical protein
MASLTFPVKVCVAAHAAEDIKANEDANAAVVIHERTLDINPPCSNLPSGYLDASAEQIYTDFYGGK